MIIIGSHMSQMDENQIDLDREDYFFRDIQRWGWKQLSRKLYHILPIEKQTDSFAEVACHLFYE